jgi:hypothetical protein
MEHRHNEVSVNDLYEAQNKLSEVNYYYWVDHALFTFNWWFLLVLFIVPWFIWWNVVDKKRIFEVLTVGLLVMTLCSILDAIGIILGAWIYEVKVIHIVPQLISMDYTVLPISYMLFYQWFPKWKPYIIGHIVLAVLGSFIVEPLFVQMKIYRLQEWHHIYSLPIYIAIGIVVKWTVQHIKKSV